MESRAKFLGHPIHPMLIVFPLGLLGMSVIFDILFLITDNEAFATVAYYNITAGIIAGLVAAIFGFWDWLSIPGGTRAKTVGLTHGIGNVIIVVLFAISWLLRRGETNFIPETTSLVLSFAGLALALFTGWLGGEMVYRLSVGVDRGAHLEAPNSLSGRPATEHAGARGTREAIPATGREHDEDK